jgi:dipeptidyl-peptidase-4
MILIACNSNQIFVILLPLIIFNIATKELTKLFDFQMQRPLLPNGKKIAYAKEIFMFMI